MTRRRPPRKPREDGPTALYLLFDKARDPLYVGISHRPRARWREHERDKPWWPLVQQRSLIWFTCRAEAMLVEQTAIEIMCPPHNRDIAPRRVPPVPGGPPLHQQNDAMISAYRDLISEIHTCFEKGETDIRIARSSDFALAYIARLRKEWEAGRDAPPS